MGQAGFTTEIQIVPRYGCGVMVGLSVSRRRIAALQPSGFSLADLRLFSRDAKFMFALEEHVLAPADG